MRRLGPINLILFLACAGLTSILTFAPGTKLPDSQLARLAVFIPATFAGAGFLQAWTRRHSKPGLSWPVSLAASTLTAACIHVAVSFSQDVSTYPLTMSWSETSRYYYASLFFARQIYGSDAAPTVLHPSRYLLQAIPYLIPDSPLWLHRLWQSLLWVSLPALAGYALARRLFTENLSGRWLLAAAVFAYLMLGPVYYHLLIPVILILWFWRNSPRSQPGSFRDGGDKSLLSTLPTAPPARRILRTQRNLVVLLLASAWAGISRVNWFPVPGLLAAVLILLEDPILPGTASDDRIGWRNFLSEMSSSRVRRYLAAPLGWTALGTVTALLAQMAYIAWSGNTAEQFTTSFSSDLLWSRLLPNPTYGPGIVLAVLIASLPPALIILGRLLMNGVSKPIHPIRLIGLAAVLGVLLVGGLLVSVKIGGGSNLHNMDAYLVVLIITGAYFGSDHVTTEAHRATGEAALIKGTSELPHRLLLAGLALVPVVISGFVVAPRGPAASLPDRQAAIDGAATIIEAAEAAAARSGEVLFISNRHLLAFGEVQGVALIPDYERVFLMEVAMAADSNTLERFYTDLREHRYALIVSEPLSRQQKGAEDVFGAENDAWVKRVAVPILCYYEPIKTLRSVQVQLLAPRAAPVQNCP